MAAPRATRNGRIAAYCRLPIAQPPSDCGANPGCHEASREVRAGHLAVVPRPAGRGTHNAFSRRASHAPWVGTEIRAITIASFSRGNRTRAILSWAGHLKRIHQSLEAEWVAPGGGPVVLLAQRSGSAARPPAVHCGRRTSLTRPTSISPIRRGAGGSAALGRACAPFASRRGSSSLVPATACASCRSGGTGRRAGLKIP